MNSRERIRLTLKHQEPDQVPIQDSPWQATIDRWRQEGLPQDVPVEDYFGYEMAGFAPDLSPQFTYQLIEQDERFIVERDGFGRITKNFYDRSTTPQIIKTAVQTREDWEKIKPRLQPNETRVNWGPELAKLRKEQEKGRFITYNAAMGYDLFQNYLKSQDLLIQIVMQPDWVKDMFITHAELLVAMAEMMSQGGFQFDGAFLCDDLGYRNASLFSPRDYQKTLFDADKLICNYFNSKHIPIILHSCGNVKELIPYFIKAGFACLHPLEAKAGLDVRELKKEFGKDIAFMGNIDVRLMNDPVKIEDEIRSKFEAAMPGGGYIYHSDHSVPKNISFDNYKRAIQLVKKYGQS